MGELTDDEQAAVYAADIVCSSASLIGSLFVIIMYLGFKEIRSFSFRLVVYLSIFDCMYAVGILIGPADNWSTCMVQSIIVSYFPLGTIIWTNIIAYALYMALIKRVDNIERYEKKFILVGILAPILGTVLPLSTDSYGKSRFGECWIMAKGDDRVAGTIWQLLQFYLPLWIGFVFNAVLYYKVSNFVKAMMAHAVDMDEEQKKLKMRLMSRLKYYPLALIFCWTFATIDQFYLFFKNDDPSFGLALLDVSFGSSQGLLNAMIYGFNPLVMSTLLNSFSQCMPCIRRKPKKQESEQSAKI